MAISPAFHINNPGRHQITLTYLPEEHSIKLEIENHLSANLNISEAEDIIECLSDIVSKANSKKLGTTFR